MVGVRPRPRCDTGEDNVMVRQLFVLLSLHLLIGGLAAVEAGEVTGTISYLYVRDSDGLVYVHVAGAITDRAACASTTGYWMVPNENSETGKKLYALLLSAKLTGASIRVVGKGTCVRWGDGEDINFVGL